MSNSQDQLFIPDKIKVGFQNRNDTYTKKLAYVIYYDKKGKLRKEVSWQNWRDDKIEPAEYDNTPTEGFVLNKGVGGTRESYGWNTRNEYIRVYDPRDFEFEISVANLLFILRECDCSRGKGLEGKFVYAWNGTELVLLPEGSTDYQSSKNFTDLQSCKVSVKDLIKGASYQTKKQEIVVYLGRFMRYNIDPSGVDSEDDSYSFSSSRTRKSDLTGLKHVFWNGDDFEFYSGLKDLAVLHTDVIHPDYATLVDQYNKSIHGSKPVRLFLKTKEDTKDDRGYVYNYQRMNFDYEYADGEYMECVASLEKDMTPYAITAQKKYYIKDGLIVYDKISETIYKDWEAMRKHRYGYNYYHFGQYNEPANKVLLSYREPTNEQLWVELESGLEFRVEHGYLISKSAKEKGN